MQLNSGSGPLEWLTSRLKLVFLETWFRGLALCYVLATLHKARTSLERRHAARPTTRGRSIPDPRAGIDQARVKPGEYRSAPASFVKETPDFLNISPQSLPV